VYCQLGYLSDCLPGRIRDALGELPETLDGTYERILREIKSTNWEFARRLFLCVAVASRPLRAEELAELLAFDFKAGPIPKFREDWRLEDPLEAVLSTCSTLLALVNVDNSPVIQFSHFSVKEFLTSTRFSDKRDTISLRYHVSMTPAHTLVAQACLGVLLHLDKNVTNGILDQFPLAEYAAKHWTDHARFEGVSENVEEGMKELLDTNKPHFAIWVWIYDPIHPSPYGRTERPFPPLRTPLHYAAFCGLHTIINFLASRRPQDVHHQDSDNSTPLHLASRAGHIEVARSLVEHGADAKAQDNNGWTALHFSVQAGRVDLSRLLLEHGADATVYYSDRTTLLHAVVPGGSVDLVRLLVEHGADVTAQDEDKWTPLHLSVRHRRMDLIYLLLEHGADVTAQGQDRSTPLHLAVLEDLAVREGSLDFTRLLVGHGADVTAKDEQGSTPLHLAVREGCVELARFLVEHGADATALGAISEIVVIDRFLVGHGVDMVAHRNAAAPAAHNGASIERYHHPILRFSPSRYRL
jgi:ankyrin repeat protein